MTQSHIKSNVFLMITNELISWLFLTFNKKPYCEPSCVNFTCFYMYCIKWEFLTWFANKRLVFRTVQVLSSYLNNIWWIINLIASVYENTWSKKIKAALRVSEEYWTSIFYQVTILITTLCPHFSEAKWVSSGAGIRILQIQEPACQSCKEYQLSNSIRH